VGAAEVKHTGHGETVVGVVEDGSQDAVTSVVDLFNAAGIYRLMLSMLM
jgi:ketopantoate reductase